MKRINPQVRAEIEEQYGHLLHEFGGRIPEPESELEFNRCIQVLQEAMPDGVVALRLQEAVFDSVESSVLAGESEEARRKEMVRDASNKVLGGRDEHGRYGLSRGKLQAIGLVVGAVALLGGGYAFISSSKLPTSVETAEGEMPAAPENAGTAAGVDSANIDDVQDPESVFTQEPGALQDDTQDGVVSVAGSDTDTTTSEGFGTTEPDTVASAPLNTQTVTPVSSPVYVDPVVQPQPQPQVAVPVSQGAGDPVVVQSPQSTAPVALGPVAVTPVAVTPVGVGPAAATGQPIALGGGSERPQPVVLASGSDAALNASAGAAGSPLPGVVDPDTAPVAQPAAEGSAQPAEAGRPSSQVYRREAAAQSGAGQAGAAGAARSAVVYRQARTPGTGRVYGVAGGQTQTRAVQASAGAGAQTAPVVSSAPVATATSSGGDLNSQINAAFGGSSQTAAPKTEAASPATEYNSGFGTAGTPNDSFGTAPAQTTVSQSAGTQGSQGATQAAAQPQRTASSASTQAASTQTARGGVIYRDVASARTSAPLNRSVYSAREPSKSEVPAAAPKASNPYGAGSVVKAGLVLKIIVAEGGESFVVAKLDSGENVIGTAKLGSGRVEMTFTRLITPSGEVGIQARGVGSDGALGVPATVLPKNPTLLQDLARSAFSGASNYFNQFTRSSTSTTFTPGGLPLVTNSAPAINLSLKDSVLSSLAGAVKLPNTEGLKFINVAEVAVNTPLQVVFF